MPIEIKVVTQAEFDAWVKANREFVDKASNGQIAYVHIRAMNQPSLRVFQNEINEFWMKKGLIVDIRYNGGGNIDRWILERLHVITAECLAGYAAYDFHE